MRLEPIHNPPAGDLSSFDQGHQLNLLGNLQLDQEDEPKRGVSRANSVRFDESAIQGHWTRSSGDLIPSRTGSGLGSHPMIDRPSSHKSDGRQSSAGQSIHSASFAPYVRTNSLGLDTSFLLGQHTGPSFEASGPPLAMALLGPVPSIIRCWLDTNYSHETLIYAAICTGSYESLLNLRLVHHLGLENDLQTMEDGKHRIKLPVYLPEAVLQQPSSRSSSPAPQLPALTIEFTVFDQQSYQQKQIEVFLGSDALRAYNADILFSQNSMTLHGDNHSKYSVPLVRPEDQRLFKRLYIANLPDNEGLHLVLNRTVDDRTDFQNDQAPPVNFQRIDEPSKEQAENLRQITSLSGRAPSQQTTSPRSPHPQPPAYVEGIQKIGRNPENVADALAPSYHPKSENLLGNTVSAGLEKNVESSQRATSYDRNRNDQSARRNDEVETPMDSPSLREPPGGVWGSWRRENGTRQEAPNSSSSSGGGYQRAGRPRGMKVLRPSKSSIPSSSAPRPYPNSQPSIGVDTVSVRSRDPAANIEAYVPQPREPRASTSSESKSASGAKETRSGTGQPRSANPVGGASAFSWLNGSQHKRSPATPD